MKIVLDTNVLVSGLLSAFGPPGEIVRLVTARAIRLCYDARVLGEYRQILLRPAFPFSPARVASLLEQIQADGEPVEARLLPERLPDPDDEVFLAVALAGQTGYLVTGNLKHYPRRHRQGVEVVSPRDFVELYRSRR